MLLVLIMLARLFLVLSIGRWCMLCLCMVRMVVNSFLDLV